MKLRIGDTVCPKKMITSSNKQHMFEDDTGTVIDIKSQKDESWWINSNEERLQVRVKSNVTGEIFCASEDFWITI